jgi:mono/diheme cytochrome c family protein
MTKFKAFAAAAFCAAAMLGAAGAGVQAQDAPVGDTAKGKAVFLKEACFTCHGRAGQGGAYNGPAPILAHTALPFEGFKAQIRNPVNDMPAYSDAVLSDQDIADIYAFVKSLPGSRSPKDIPILNN